MNSSQESDISFHSFGASQSSQGELSSQEEERVIPGNDSDNETILDDDNDGWTRNLQPIQVNDFDDSAVGPAHALPNTASPLDFFKLFWTHYVTDLIVTETNR